MWAEGQSKDKTVVIRGVALPITPRYQHQGQRHRVYGDKTGTLVTIHDAYKRVFRHFGHELFDEYFMAIEGIEVVKQTQPERHKDTTNLNNKRYVILKSTTEDPQIDIGSSVVINGVKFNIMYSGMTKYCFLCEKKHGRDCPARNRFEELKRMRKGKTQKRKLYSDSTLSKVNQLALTTDVMCMSGGGIGQVCNVVPLDEKHDEVLIHAGSNEIRNVESLQEFVFTVEKAAEKLKKLAEQLNVTVVLPCAPTVGAHEQGKATYFEEKITEIETIKTIKLEPVEYEFIHPSETGTVEIIEQIQKAIGEKIVLQGAENEVSTHRKYSQVKPVFKVGCRGCDTTDFTQHLCARCKEDAKSVDIQYLKDIITKIDNESFPNMEIEFENTKEKTKREREESNDIEINAKNAKKDRS